MSAKIVAGNFHDRRLRALLQNEVASDPFADSVSTSSARILRHRRLPSGRLTVISFCASDSNGLLVQSERSMLPLSQLHVTNP